jgi:hypothetical protein
MRVHGFCFQQTDQTRAYKLAVFSKKQYLPRLERGGGRVLFLEGSWSGLLERLWFVAPFLFVEISNGDVCSAWPV